ncbi:MAG: hypothetical protein B6U94_01805 [Thermofilum sp. ex4484_79]|nr:MAG: hypothetical protein B6U94_01805 [Thermofilum sp. ex4484_79]RLE60520.1 MAG: hypothetical protein DRJ35_03005 [Thermoprotei archaeon]
MKKDWKYELPIVNLEKSMRVSRALTQELKGVLSSKMIAKMKKEAVDCPVLNKRVSFLQCYNCSNFIRRVKGIVYCKGLPLNE